MTSASPTAVLGQFGPRGAARVISEVLGPVPLGVLLCVGVGASTDRLAGAGWGLLAILLAAVLPYIATWRMRHPADGRRPSRKVRVGYLLIALLGAAAGVALTAVLGAPSRIVAVTATILAGLTAAAITNARQPASNHTAAAAGGATILAVLYGPVFLAGYVVAAIVGWSRVRLGNHTLTEVLLGAVVGAAVSALVLPPLL